MPPQLPTTVSLKFEPGALIQFCAWSHEDYWQEITIREAGQTWARTLSNGGHDKYGIMPLGTTNEKSVSFTAQQALKLEIKAISLNFKMEAQECSFDAQPSLSKGPVSCTFYKIYRAQEANKVYMTMLVVELREALPVKVAEEFTVQQKSRYLLKTKEEMLLDKYMVFQDKTDNPTPSGQQSAPGKPDLKRFDYADIFGPHWEKHSMFLEELVHDFETKRAASPVDWLDTYRKSISTAMVAYSASFFNYWENIQGRAASSGSTKSKNLQTFVQLASDTTVKAGFILGLLKSNIVKVGFMFRLAMLECFVANALEKGHSCLPKPSDEPQPDVTVNDSGYPTADENKIKETELRACVVVMMHDLKDPFESLYDEMSASVDDLVDLWVTRYPSVLLAYAKTAATERTAVEEAYTDSRCWIFSFEERMEVMYNFPNIEYHGYKEVHAASPHTIIVSVPGITSDQVREDVQVRSWNLRGGLVREEGKTKDGELQTVSIRLSLYHNVSQNAELDESFDRLWYNHKACAVHVPHPLTKDYGVVILVATLANGGECVAVDMGNAELSADTSDIESGGKDKADQPISKAPPPRPGMPPPAVETFGQRAERLRKNFPFSKAKLTLLGSQPIGAGGQLPSGPSARLNWVGKLEDAGMDLKITSITTLGSALGA